MSRKEYYSQRKQGFVKLKFSFDDILELFYSIYNELEEGQYFTEYFGYTDNQYNFTLGLFGSRPLDKVFMITKKKNLYPIYQYYKTYSEEDLFDIIEFLYDHCSEPIFFNGKQIHTSKNIIFANKENGQKKFRKEINKILEDCKDGLELTEEGRIETLNKEGLEEILDQEIVSLDIQTDLKVNESVKIFRRSGTILEKENAILQILGVLEHFRNDYKSNPINNKDENEIFNLANGFSIRHYNMKQKDKYPKELYCSWIFHICLATYHLWVRLIKASSVILK